VEEPNQYSYSSFSDMPTALVAVFAAYGFLESGFYLHVLNEVLPAYLEEANRIPLASWGWRGWL
jgi:hypothetical protein